MGRARSKPKPKPKPSPPPVAEDYKLHGFWRFVLLALGVAFLAAAVYMWFWPPTTETFAPQATNTTATTIEVEDRSEAAALLLIGLGTLGFILAANGRKIASAKIADQELTFRDEAAQVAEEKTKQKAKDAGLSPRKADIAMMHARVEAYSRAASRDLEGLDFDAIADSAVTSAATLED